MKQKKSMPFTNEFSDPPESEFSYQTEENIPGGESVRVALRLRPMNSLQSQRGDSNCFKIIDDCNCQLVPKNGQVLKNFRFTHVLPERTKQNEVYTELKIDDYIQSALNGYSVTVFAYGQTGSGKTYTMAGKQQNFQQDIFKSDQTDGIIPRAIKNLWKYSQQKNERFSIKASFTQIYNQQIKDLLNPLSGVLHCRWNPANGFFVQDLIIVDCTSIDDLIAVLNEGIKNRKSGSHDLNKDSSRSHSLMTIYMIGQTETHDNRSIKKYGKLTFVDLAGSERLKQSKSAGQMAKQTANINKSLFTLGKVIKSLSDRKVKVPYIPYRDSKLTMLLMDSLGGTSKALMVACVSPASAYFDETLSTLNYATRTMNIKNKPVIQMEQKDQIIYGLMRERDLLRLENDYLRSQIEKATKGKGLAFEIPKIQTNKKNLPPLSKGAKIASNKPMSLQKTQSSQLMQKSNLKSASKELRNSDLLRNHQKLTSQKGNRPPVMINLSSQSKMQIEVSLQKIIQQYEFQLARLQTQNQQLRNVRQVAQKNYMIVSNDNNALQIKLQNLEQLFIKNSTSGKKNINQQYMNCNLIAQNKMIRNKILSIEDEIFQLKSNFQDQKIKQQKGSFEEKQIKVVNKNLKERLQFFRKREMELIALINKRK